MSRFIAATTFLACSFAMTALPAQVTPQPAPAVQPQYNPAQGQPPQYNAPQYPTQQNPAQYNPAQMVNPQMQRQLTPEQQRQLEQARQAQLPQRTAQPQYDPRLQPAQYQPPVNNATPGQQQQGIAPNGQPGQNPAQPGMAPTQLQPVQMQPARAPFQLTPQQETELEMTLKSWETSSAAVKTFHSDFIRWEYDPVWGPQNSAKTEANGWVRYQAPDKGLFQITTAKNYNPTTSKFEPSNDETQKEHWVCDGTYVFHVNHKDKQMIKTELPPNMRGTQIADGPLPFVFGQKADKLKARFWVRIVTPPGITDQIWLEAFPKYQADAANYKKVDLILDSKKLLPLAIQTHDPNPQTNIRVVYQFSGHKVNGLFDNTWITTFIEPKVPSGYKLVEERYNDPAAQPPQQKPLQAEVPGAQRK
jgi:TIGR03009 family protein